MTSDSWLAKPRTSLTAVWPQEQASQREGTLSAGTEAETTGLFDALFLAYYDGIYRLLYRITGSREEAEDLAQETFLRLHRAAYLWDRERSPDGQEHNSPGALRWRVQDPPVQAGTRPAPTLCGSVRAWLYRVAVNLAYNALRSRGRRQRREEATAQTAWAVGSPAPDPAEAAIRSDERAAVRRALAALPERQAQLLLLRHAGLSYRELAEALHIAPGSVGTLLARAGAAFEKAYQEEKHEV